MENEPMGRNCQPFPVAYNFDIPKNYLIDDDFHFKAYMQHYYSKCACQCLGRLLLAGYTR